MLGSKRFITNFEEYLLVLSLFFSVSLIFVQVVMRHVFHSSITWSEELARYIFVWQTWLGASFAVRERRHLRMLGLVSIAKGKRRIAIEIGVLIIWFAFCVFLAVKATEVTHLVFKRQQLSAAMQLPMWYFYLAVPTGAGLMAFRLLQEIRGLFRNYRNGEEAV